MKELNSDVCKEFLTYLYNFNEELINKIPERFIKSITREAAKSNKIFHIKKNKSLLEQKISDECKDLITYVYIKYLN